MRAFTFCLVLLVLVACGPKEQPAAPPVDASTSTASSVSAPATASPAAPSSTPSAATTSPAAPSSTPSTVTSASRMQVTAMMEGKIVSRDEARNQLTVDHKKVEGMMDAMTMAYDVRGAKASSLPPDGTEITAMLHEENGNYYLTDVKKK